MIVVAIRSVHARMGLAGIRGFSDDGTDDELDTSVLAFVETVHNRGAFLLATRVLEVHAPDRLRPIDDSCRTRTPRSTVSGRPSAAPASNAARRRRLA